MATNVTHSTEMVVDNWTNGTGSAVSRGDIVVMGSTGDATLAVALVDIANGSSGSVATQCEVVAPKVSAAVFKQGESLIWDASAGAFDDNQATPASGDVGGSAKAAADGADTETTCRIWLTGQPGTLTA